ncbi:MFS transporter [Sinorhizobium americanum]|uniref:MFS transporter n=1 Tax=Sinorhizobium americanum TaxID=194963 RepID=UPI000BE7CD36|nr:MULTISPECIES: MFS transporter [Sinorhizobium]
MDFLDSTSLATINVDFHPSIATAALATFSEGTQPRRQSADPQQSWALMRDLQDPQQWTETYHTPTGVDYMHNHVLHQGEGGTQCQAHDRASGDSARRDLFHKTQLDQH